MRLHRVSIFSGLLGFRLIIRFDRFSFLAQVSCLIELFLDTRNLLVEHPTDHRRYFFPDRQADNQQHGERNPHGCVQTKSCRSGMRLCAAMGFGAGMFNRRAIDS